MTWWYCHKARCYQYLKLFCVIPDVSTTKAVLTLILTAWASFITRLSMSHWAYTVITWYTSSWCVQRSPHIAVETETNTTLMINICLIKTGEQEINEWMNKWEIDCKNKLGCVQASCSPLLKGIWLHQGLMFHNWCQYYSCTETKHRPGSIINTLHCTIQDGISLWSFRQQEQKEDLSPCKALNWCCPQSHLRIKKKHNCWSCSHC